MEKSLFHDTNEDKTESPLYLTQGLEGKKIVVPCDWHASEINAKNRE
jgi:hypothetical protein